MKAAGIVRIRDGDPQKNARRHMSADMRCSHAQLFSETGSPVPHITY